MPLEADNRCEVSMGGRFVVKPASRGARKEEATR